MKFKKTVYLQFILLMFNFCSYLQLLIQFNYWCIQEYLFRIQQNNNFAVYLFVFFRMF